MKCHRRARNALRRLHFTAKGILPYLQILSSHILSIKGRAYCAAPAAKRQDSSGPLCHYLMTPSSFPGEVGLSVDMNFALGRALSEEAPGFFVKIGLNTVDGPQDDGTYKVGQPHRRCGLDRR
ncbi:hypothetical protein LshimejAT787_0902010 [Lyophyllum shimeji]|uniref:Uncharacterized protein n=1 Tax=Lyophyllum shimeji TaxID=47721 RepID=A0A9P3PSM3_LYOSH|nr:hypothetical protein LshimejAT787_0902010 [Lyophyllum shimeji]